MIDKNELQVILKKDVQALETYRLELAKKAKPIYRRKTLFAFLVFLVVSAVILFFITGYKVGAMSFWTILMLLFFIVPTFLGITRSFHNRFENQLLEVEHEFQETYKTNVIRPITKRILPQSNYQPTEGIAKKDFLASQIFDDAKINYHSEDLVQGKYKTIHFQFANLTAKKERIEEGKSILSPLLEGLFFIIDLPIKTDSFSIFSKEIKEHVAQWTYNQFPPSLEAYKKSFSISSNIPKEIKPSFIQKILERFSKLDQEFGAETIFHIKNQKLYLAINWKVKLFAPKLNQSLLDLNVPFPKKMKQEVLDAEAGFEQVSNQAIEKYYEEVLFCTEILEEINSFAKEINVK